jgi:hypothetical protein
MAGNQEVADPQVERNRRIEALGLVRLKLLEERFDVSVQLRVANIARDAGWQQSRRPNQLTWVRDAQICHSPFQQFFLEEVTVQAVDRKGLPFLQRAAL